MSASIDFVTTPGGVAVGTLFDRFVREAEFEQVRAAFRDLLADPAVQFVVLDFFRVEFFEANLRGQMVWLSKKLNERGGRLAVCRLGHMVEQMRMSRLDKLILLFDDLDAAVAAVRPAPRRRYTSQWTAGVLIIGLTRDNYISYSDDEPAVFQREVKDVVAALPDPPLVALDLSQVRYLSSPLLSGIITVTRTAAARGGELLLCQLAPDVAATIQQADPAGKLFQVVDTVDAAVSRLAARRPE